MTMQLYYTPNSNPRLAVAVARYLGSPVEFIRAAPRHPAHREAFRSINPNTLAPVLVEPTGTLWETDAIACRLSMLAGSDFWRSGTELPEMIRWVSWSAHHFLPAAAPAYFEHVVIPTFSPNPPDMEKVERSIAEFREWAPVLETALEGKTWLVGDRLSYADFRVATYLPFAEKAGLPLRDYPKMTQWHNRLMEIQAWRDPFAGLLSEA